MKHCFAAAAMAGWVRLLHNVIASEAKQSSLFERWIASSL
jgi:hypothetical protein